MQRSGPRVEKRRLQGAQMRADYKIPSRGLYAAPPVGKGAQMSARSGVGLPKSQPWP